MDGGVSEKVKVMAKEAFNYVSTTEEDLGSIKKNVVFNKKVVAPIKKGDTVGKIEYFIGDKSIGSVDVIASKNIEKASFANTLKKLFSKYIL